MMIRIFTIAILLITNISTSFANDSENKILVGFKFQKSNNRYFLSLEQNEGSYSLTPDSERNNLKHEIYFSETLNYQGTSTKLTHTEGVDYRFSNNSLLGNRTNYSGYRNVEGFQNNTRSRNRKFAATAVTGGLIVTGIVVGTIVLIINAI